MTPRRCRSYDKQSSPMLRQDGQDYPSYECCNIRMTNMRRAAVRKNCALIATVTYSYTMWSPGQLPPLLTFTIIISPLPRWGRRERVAEIPRTAKMGEHNSPSESNLRKQGTARDMLLTQPPLNRVASADAST
jgi:hypothetical protein